MTRIAFVTYSGSPALTSDDQLSCDCLVVRGAHVEAIPWDDGTAEWAAFDAVVIRSCWDYHLRTEEFHSWLDCLEAAGAPVWNPVPVLRWNADKRYLRDLAGAGVATVPTRWVERGTDADLESLLAQEGWTQAVVKPVVSATAHETWRTSLASAASDAPRFRSLAARSGVMVQPFLSEIEFTGEWSVCFLGGRYSHAVRKLPKQGDFRVQPQFGGITLPQPADSEIVRQAGEILRAVSGPWLYARVDGCMIDGRFWLIELEMLEPSLFLGSSPGAPDRFADAILQFAHGELPTGAAST